MVLGWILTGVNCAVIEPIGYGAAKSVDESCTGIHPVQSRAERLDVFTSELQSRGVMAEDHVSGGFFTPTQTARVMALLVPLVKNSGSGEEIIKDLGAQHARSIRRNEI